MLTTNFINYGRKKKRDFNLTAHKKEGTSRNIKDPKQLQIRNDRRRQQFLITLDEISHIEKAPNINVCVGQLHEA